MRNVSQRLLTVHVEGFLCLFIDQCEDLKRQKLLKRHEFQENVVEYCPTPRIFAIHDLLNPFWSSLYHAPVLPDLHKIPGQDLCNLRIPINTSSTRNMIVARVGAPTCWPHSRIIQEK